MTGAKDALGHSRSQSWTANSDVQTTTDALGAGTTPGNSTAVTYDALNNATGTTLPTGAAASAQYATGTNCPGTGGTAYQPKCTRDSAGEGQKFDYDPAGNLLKITDTTSTGTGVAAQQFTYQGGAINCGGFAGQVCSSKDGRGNVVTYGYDVDGNLTSVTPPGLQGATTYVYDSLGRLSTVTNGLNDPTTYLYNSRDEIVRTTFRGGAILDSTWYPNGLQATEVDSVNGSKTYSYDPLGRITREAGPHTAVESYGYDATGNITSYTDASGTITYSYDAANRLTQAAEPGGTCQATAGSSADSGCTKFEYDNNNGEIKRTYPGNATVLTTLDLSGRATRITGKNTAGTTVLDVGYSYAAGGISGSTADRSSIQARVSYREAGIPAGATTTYAYDSLGRITNASEKVGTALNASWSYAYDATGNRTQQTRAGNTGAAAGTINYAYNSVNQISSTSADSTTWLYDAAGNQLRNGITGQTATYNSQLTTTSIGSGSYTAFGQGNNEQLTRSALATTYSTTALGLSQETLSGGDQRNYTRSSGGEAISTRSNSGSKHYYVYDALGSVIGLFDKAGTYAGGYSYSPYGESRASAAAGSAVDSNSLRYIGGYADRASGLYKLGSRYYDPTLGRFTQPDPTGQEGNPYTYSAADPVNRSDPSGNLAPLLAIGAAVVFRALAPTVARGFASRVAGSRVGTTIGNQIMNPSNARYFGKNQGFNTGAAQRTGISVKKGQPGSERPAFRTGNRPQDHYFLD